MSSNPHQPQQPPQQQPPPPAFLLSTQRPGGRSVPDLLLSSAPPFSNKGEAFAAGTPLGLLGAPIGHPPLGGGSAPPQHLGGPLALDMSGRPYRRSGSGPELRLPKRSDLAESPSAKAKYKEFAKGFREAEKQSFEVALSYARDMLLVLPDSIKHKLFMDLADSAKRHNRVQDAKSFYLTASRHQPLAYQVWLEWSKLEEECGELALCTAVLREGLRFCPTVEALIIKGIKHAERMGNLSDARAILARMQHLEAEKGWKILIEGALMEARAERLHVARRVCKYLMEHARWHGPVFQEALRLEERAGNYSGALAIAERGLAEVPRYGPLWFSCLRLLERTGASRQRVQEALQQALQSVSRELVWKVWFEAAQLEARRGDLPAARGSYVHAARSCPDNLRWKVWLGAVRTELGCGNVATVRLLLGRALAEVPKKSRAMVLLECSRLEEQQGNVERARAILAHSCRQTHHEWKIFLEAVLLEYRAGCLDAAIAKATHSLETHPGTGRLWAILIQLRHREGAAAQMAVFRMALREVPKSGEVWCEGARVRMNPLSPAFDLREARRYLDFAVQFTPQYGDSFIEYMRLELLERGPSFNLESLKMMCINADPNYGALWCHCKEHVLSSAREIVERAHQMLVDELAELQAVYLPALLRHNQGREQAAASAAPASAVDDAAAAPTAGGALAYPASLMQCADRDRCVLCKYPLRSAPTVRLGCSHTFHLRCALAFASSEGSTAPSPAAAAVADTLGSSASGSGQATVSSSSGATSLTSSSVSVGSPIDCGLLAQDDASMRSCPLCQEPWIIAAVFGVSARSRGRHGGVAGRAGGSTHPEPDDPVLEAGREALELIDSHSSATQAVVSFLVEFPPSHCFQPFRFLTPPSPGLS